MRTRTLLMVMLPSVCAILACGDDGPTGPSNAEIAGSWTYNVTNFAGTLSGQSVSCDISDLTLTLRQEGATFSGETAGGTLRCSSGGQTVEGTLGGMTVVSGTVTGNEITFNFDTSDWRHTGTVSGASMSGSTVAEIDLGDQVVTLSGNWAAGRDAAAALASVPQAGETAASILQRIPR